MTTAGKASKDARDEDACTLTGQTARKPRGNERARTLRKRNVSRRHRAGSDIKKISLLRRRKLDGTVQLDLAEIEKFA